MIELAAAQPDGQRQVRLRVPKRDLFAGQGIQARLFFVNDEQALDFGMFNTIDLGTWTRAATLSMAPDAAERVLHAASTRSTRLINPAPEHPGMFRLGIYASSHLPSGTPVTILYRGGRIAEGTALTGGDHTVVRVSADTVAALPLLDEQESLQIEPR